MCGDGLLQADKQCDDGVLNAHGGALTPIAGDGCSASRQTEADWACAEGGASSGWTVCGDAIVMPDFEGCDDGNTLDVDG